jgi:hypothetical protein
MHCIVVQVSVLGCGDMSLGDWCPTFWDTMLVPSTRAKNYSRTSWPLKMKWPCSFKTLCTNATVTWDHIPEEQESQMDCCIIQSISDIIVSLLLNHTLIGHINLLHIFTTIFILHAHYFHIFTRDSLVKIYGHEWLPFSCLMYHLPHYIYSSTITVKSKMCNTVYTNMCILSMAYFLILMDSEYLCLQLSPF